MELAAYERLPKNERGEVGYGELTEIRKKDVDTQSMDILNYLEEFSYELSNKEVITYTHAYDDNGSKIIKDYIDEGTEYWHDLFDIKEVYEIVTKNFELCHYDDCEHTLETYDLHLKECCNREFPDTRFDTHYSIIKWFSARGVDYEKYIKEKNQSAKEKK